MLLKERYSTVFTDIKAVSYANIFKVYSDTDLNTALVLHFGERMLTDKAMRSYDSIVQMFSGLFVEKWDNILTGYTNLITNGMNKTTTTTDDRTTNTEGSGNTDTTDKVSAFDSDTFADDKSTTQTMGNKSEVKDGGTKTVISSLSMEDYSKLYVLLLGSDVVNTILHDVTDTICKRFVCGI